MTTHSLKYTVILLIICKQLVIIQCSDYEILDPLLSRSSIQIKGNQDNIDTAQSNTLDIHLAMQSPSNLLNLRETIRNEIRILLMSEFNASAIKNTGDEKPIAERSTNNNLQKTLLGLEKNLNYVVNDIKLIKQQIKSNGNVSKILSEETANTQVCLKENNFLEVFYKPGTKILNQDSAEYPKNCKQVQHKGNNVTGIYEIYPRYSKKPYAVLCDMDIRGGGWTNIQKRYDGSQDFSLGWREYKFGFGNLEGEFWLGLENIYLLTDFEKTELLVEIVDRDNVTAYAYYNTFAIGPESSGYTLERLSGFSGDAGDSLTYHLGKKFSTMDLDFSNNCATKYLGAWWYNDCHYSNLNGKYINIDLPAKFNYQGLHWKTFRSHEYSHSRSRMLIRPSI